jgi:hypothetical protein
MDSQRILETSSDRWQRSLLQAAAAEAAPEAATAQVLRALEGLPQPLPDGAAGAAAPASLARSGTLKLAGLILAAVGIGVCVYWLGSRERHTETPVSPSIAARKVEPPAKQRESPPVAPQPDDQPLAQTDNIPSSAPTRAPSGAKSARAQGSASAGDALSRELRSLRAVRERVQARDAAAALRLLAEYHQSFPRGVLQPEAAELERRASALSAAH